jgi:hypothetical protein
VSAAGTFIATGSTVVNALDSVASGVAGAVATKNPDGTYTLKRGIGPINFDDPMLKSIASGIVYGASEVLKGTQAGKVLFIVLSSCYEMFMKSYHKP